jgi:cytoskeleton-associated protein 5
LTIVGLATHDKSELACTHVIRVPYFRILTKDCTFSQLWESSEDESVFEEFSSILHKAVGDSNVNAQDKALEAAILFSRKASTQLVGRYAASIMSKAIDKAAGQAKCKSKVQDLALQFIEAESGEAVAEELIKGCAHKQPKIAGACAEALRMSVEAFGLRALGAQSKAVVKLTVTMFDSTVAPVRSEAKPLAVELFKYMGAALRPSYDNLRPAQQKELDEAFSSAPPAQPTRLTRSAAVKAASSAAAASDTVVKGAAGPTPSVSVAGGDIDPLEFLDPVEVLSKLPSGWCEKVLAAPKWQEKKEFLDTLIDLAKTPKLASGDYSEVVKTLKRLMGDSMVLVVSTAITAFSMLAAGLRKEFKQCAQISLATLLDKFKEKDKRVIEAIHSALDAIYGRCLSMLDFSEELMTALGPKGGAKAKIEVLKFLKRAIDSKLSPVIPKNVRPLVELVVKTTEDSAPEIRDGACAVLSSLLSTSGMAQMKVFLESMDEKKRKKVESMSDSAPSSGAAVPSDADSGPIAAPSAPKTSTLKKPSAPTVSAPPAKAESSDPPPPAKKAVARIVSTGSTKSATAGSKSSAPAKAASGQAKDDSEADVTAGTSLEELDAMVDGIVSDSIRAKLLSSNWKERLEGMEELETDVKDRIDSLHHPMPEAMTRLLIKSFVDKKETNFQVPQVLMMSFLTRLFDLTFNLD